MQLQVGKYGSALAAAAAVVVAYGGNIEVVRLLIESGVDVNV
jgi:hypothetical protein